MIILRMMAICGCGTRYDVEVWDDWARLAGEQLRRGHQIQVEGRLKQDEWNDKTTGAQVVIKNHSNLCRHAN